ncbi:MULTISPECIES: type 1 fimbrial protein [unclassified Enterobacter]|uniref:type 1 fimbrial protein n=1 Tax=unclassified Enterobacter TaxID=2608935 RepID=UPI002148DF60|nr:MULTISPECIES: type 1 fimbrial protein [unclassified Enterobacter]MCR1303405.1 type 1 fimbrial protein [Enterobacter sp. FL1277]MCR1308332.1 type 1 fimbrial protein [Enterobacter sp. BT1271]MCR1313608.1 type 1 fimbrial protein [Enterobacter sp. BT855]MCR1323943.1 type 1 fimbrial protein [Enterobacter sp. BT1268]MCR1329117.1 type 1 fimbrial protein [Enterobacter sp. BT1131]
MTKYLAQLATGLGLRASAFILPAYSATLANGGVIHFRGAIVADPCEVTPQQRQFAMSCPDNNRMQTRMVSYEEALNGTVTDSSLATLSMKYLNPEKTLAIVQIQYR